MILWQRRARRAPAGPRPAPCAPRVAGISPNLGPTKKEGFYSADPSPHPREFATSDASPPLLELPGATPDGHASSRGYAGSGKKVSFADDAEGGEASRGRVLSDSAEAVGYSTDDEEEAAAQPPPPSSPQRVPSRIHEAAAAMCACLLYTSPSPRDS